jgi:ABC-2 type transport system permease protein
MVLQGREAAQAKSTLVTSVIQPVVYLIVGLRISPSSDATYTTRVIVGSVMIALWTSTLWGAGTLLRREIIQGTFAAVLTRPSPFAVVLLGKSFTVALVAFVRAATATALAELVIQAPVVLPDPAPLVMISLLALISSASLGVALSALVLLTRGGLRIFESLSYPVFVFGGRCVSCLVQCAGHRTYSVCTSSSTWLVKAPRATPPPCAR